MVGPSEAHKAVIENSYSEDCQPGLVQADILPLLQQLVEFNSQLRDIFQKSLALAQKSESKGKEKGDSPSYDPFNIDLERGVSVTSSEDTSPLIELTDMENLADNFECGCLDNATHQQKEPAPAEASFRGESSTKASTQGTASDQPSVPERQWLVPYATFLPQIIDGGAFARGRINSSPSADHSSDGSEEAYHEQNHAPSSLIKFYTTMFLSTEYLGQEVIDQERETRVNGEPKSSPRREGYWALMI